ncbi:MAG: hypothetical protein AAGH17_05690, partial [Pseudomonadota bacterium]
MAFHSTDVRPDTPAQPWPWKRSQPSAARVVDLIPNAARLIKAATLLGPVTAQTKGGPATISAPVRYAALQDNCVTAQGFALAVNPEAWHRALLLETGHETFQHKIAAFGAAGTLLHKVICTNPDVADTLYSIEVALSGEGRDPNTDMANAMAPTAPLVRRPMMANALSVLMRVAEWQRLPMRVSVTNAGCTQSNVGTPTSVTDKTDSLSITFDSGAELEVARLSNLLAWETATDNSVSDGADPAGATLCVADPKEGGWMEL